MRLPHFFKNVGRYNQFNMIGTDTVKMSKRSLGMLKTPCGFIAPLANSPHFYFLPNCEILHQKTLKTASFNEVLL